MIVWYFARFSNKYVASFIVRLKTGSYFFPDFEPNLAANYGNIESSSMGFSHCNAYNHGSQDSVLHK